MEDTAPQPPRRWDPIVKLTHWGVVAAVIGNAIFTEEGSGWHIWVGYGLAALLALRLLWGLIGPAEARFSAFPPSPGRALEHIGEIKRGEVTPHRSHNPLGALMVYAIWATLLVISGTGIAMSGPPPADPSAVRGEHGEMGERGEKAEAGERGEAGESAAEEARERGQTAASPATPTPPAKANAERAESEEAEEREEEARERAPAAAANPAVIPALAAQGEERDEAGEARPVVSATAEADAMLAVAGRSEAGETREGDDGEEEEGELGEVHELAVNLLYVLIALHLAGVVFETRRSGPQIARAMIPGATPRD